ncbi:MAG: class I tRNA ligase family protein [Chitinophagaceae bacterium]
MSRSRYWGTPLPIWMTEDGSEEICIGSIAQLEEEVKKATAAGVLDAKARYEIQRASSNYISHT